MTSFNSLRFQPWLLWALLCCVFFMQAAQAADEAAVVLFSHGLVTVTTNAVSHDLKKGDAVLAGSTIETGPKGRAQLRFNDGGLVSLMPNTQFSVDNYSQPSESEDGAVSIQLLKGGLRALSGQIGKRNPDSYQLKTKVATLGIRGTQFTVSMGDSGMHVHVGGGQVILFNDQGELLVSAGQNAQVLPNQAPMPSSSAPNIGGASTGGGDDSEGTSNSAIGQGAADSTPDTQLAQGQPIELQQAGNQNFEQQLGQLLLGMSSPPPAPDSTPSPSPEDSRPIVAPKVAAAYYEVNQSSAFPQSAAATTLSNVNSMMQIIDSSFSSVGNDLASFELASSIGGLYHISDDLLWGWLGQDSGNPLTLFILGNNTTLPASGILSYHYTSNNSDYASQVLTSSSGDVFSLAKFNLDFHLGSNTTVDVDMKLVGSMGAEIQFSNNGGNISWRPQSSSFNFDLYDYSCSTGCRLEAAGVVTGAGKANAGIIYKLNDGMDYSGTVILNKFQNIQYQTNNAAYLWAHELSESTPQTLSVSNFADLISTLYGASQGQEFEIVGSTYNDVTIVGIDEFYRGDTLFWGAPWGSYQNASGADISTQSFIMLGQPTNLPVTGELHYSLNSNAASSVYNQLESYDDYVLEKFDLVVHLNSNSFDVDMHLDNSYEPLFFRQNGLTGELTSDGRFSFTGTQNDQTLCSECTLNAAGIITGETQQEAGVIYYLQQGGKGYAGAAALEKTSYTSN